MTDYNVHDFDGCADIKGLFECKHLKRLIDSTGRRISNCDKTGCFISVPFNKYVKKPDSCPGIEIDNLEEGFST